MNRKKGEMVELMRGYLRELGVGAAFTSGDMWARIQRDRPEWDKRRGDVWSNLRMMKNFGEIVRQGAGVDTIFTVAQVRPARAPKAMPAVAEPVDVGTPSAKELAYREFRGAVLVPKDPLAHLEEKRD